MRFDDRSYFAQVRAVHYDIQEFNIALAAGDETPRIPSVDVVLPRLRRPLRNVMVKQSFPANADASSELLPRIGDLGIVRFLNGNPDEPYWDGWLVMQQQPSYRGSEKAYRIKHSSGAILEIDDGKMGLGADLKHLKDDNGVVRKKDLANVVKFILDTVIIAWLKTHTHPTGVGPSGPPTEAATWLDTVAAEASDMARAK